jgi:hypothetical protein
MHGELNEPASGNKLARFFEEDKAVQVINDFKAELDQLRRILWFYIEHGSAQPNAATDSEQYDKPLQRMNELRRTLAPQSATSATAGEEVKPSVSFFERLDVVIDTYMRGKKTCRPSQGRKSRLLMRVRQPVVQVGDPPSRLKYQPRNFCHLGKINLVDGVSGTMIIH